MYVISITVFAASNACPYWAGYLAASNFYRFL